MRIHMVHVQRFRSIYDAALECDPLTALVGANGAGKSTFLRALAVFYNPTADIEISDFYDTAVTEDITITVTYGDLADVERSAFRKYVHRDQLEVTKRISWDMQKQKSLQAYYGRVPQHPAFVELRNPQIQFTQRRQRYSGLRAAPEYASLPATVASDAALRHALDVWEQAHPDQCESLPSQWQFFGFKQASAARLELYTRFLLIEAQRDAHLAALDERDSPIKQLLDEVVRNIIAEHEGIKALQQQAKDALRAISAQVDLRELNSGLNTTMRQFAPNTSIHLSWQDPTLSLPTPRVHLLMSEDGYATPINRTGHGVQRAFIITLLQHLAMSARQSIEGAAVETVASGDGESQTPMGETGEDPGPIQPNLILAIEEPELYQHPTRQRHFAAILRDLANGEVTGVANNIQILYCTHSPYFVDLDRFEQIRVIAKVPGPAPDAPKCTGVRATKRGEIGELSEAQLAVMMSSAVNEGFFARVAVLVEGEGDRALLHAVARCHRLPLEAHGVAIVPVQGSGNLSKPLIVFSKLGIHVYPIWDSDSDKLPGSDDYRTSARRNRALLALCGIPEEDWPTGVHPTFAVFDPKLETHLRSEIENAGLEWASVEAHAAAGSSRSNLWKKHAAVTRAVMYAAAHGCTFPETLRMLHVICRLADMHLPVTNEAISQPTVP
jgi:putative ATP-dependent endonuclease of the OLD family